MVKLRKQFQAIDVDNDGFITQIEMENSVQRLRNSFRSSELGREDLDLVALFKSMDKDGDGKISYSEFIVGATNKS